MPLPVTPETPLLHLKELSGSDAPFKWAVVVPTIATPHVLLPTLDRLVANLPDPEAGRVIIAVAMNPVLQNQGDVQARVHDRLDALQEVVAELGHFLVWTDSEEPIGFGHACNVGTRLAIREAGSVPKFTVLFNDDLRVTPGWLERLEQAHLTETVRIQGEPPSQPTEKPRHMQMADGSSVEVGQRPDRSAEDYGRIGIVGPSSVNVAGAQCVKLSDPRAQITEANADSFARIFAAENEGEYLTTNFLSGFCMSIAQDCLLDVSYYSEDGEFIGPFDGDQYPIAGYEDNALCVRCEEAGWRLLIDGSTFIYHLGHQSFDAFFPNMARGMRNRLRYYEAHRSKTQGVGAGTPPDEQQIVAAYRVRLETVTDLSYFRASLVGMSRLCDGVAILLTDNPAEIMNGSQWEAQQGSLTSDDAELFWGCVNRETMKSDSPEAVAEALRRWVVRLLKAGASKMGGKVVPVKVRTWAGDFNERDERNALLDLARGMGADWIWSVDHDELPEERVRRRHVNRWISHPDPLVASLDQAWLNVWDSTRMARADRPWGDGMTYTGGMHGFRLLRVNKAAPRKVQAGGNNGLHCGNVPDVSIEAKRVAGMRIVHLGYLHAADRRRKLARYQKQDPNPDPWLVGGTGYGHIVQEEGARFYPVVSVNGIGMHFLAYEGESADDIGRMLDWTYALADQIVMVWTGEWEDGDKAWVDDPEAPFADGAEEAWPMTGPCRDLAAYCKLFGVEIVHHPLEDNIAAARNAGLDRLQELAPEWGLGWALFLDPDEHMQNPYQDTVCMRRMAECSEGWGWLFRFYNLLPGDDQPPTLSESVRMSRLDPMGIMRMDGRVHEGFDLAAEKIRAGGDAPGYRYAPFELVNTGQAISDEAMEAKLQRYTRMLRLELADNPDSAKAWTSLGLQAENQGDLDAAVECYRRGLMCSGNSYLPAKELAAYHLRMAASLTDVVLDRTSPSHGYHRIARKHAEALAEMAPRRPLVGMARVAPETRTGLGFDLPPFEVGEE